MTGGIEAFGIGTVARTALREVGPAALETTIRVEGRTALSSLETRASLSTVASKRAAPLSGETRAAFVDDAVGAETRGLQGTAPATTKAAGTTVAPDVSAPTATAAGPAIDSPAAALQSAPPAALGAGRLRALGGRTWESDAGLIYGPGSAQGNRVLHVLEHATDIPGRAGAHGVFADGRTSAIGTIDEAYRLALAGDPSVTVIRQGSRTVYTVDMARSVGFVGGRTGASLGNPSASHVRLVLEGRNVITAFPVIP